MQDQTFACQIRPSTGGRDAVPEMQPVENGGQSGVLHKWHPTEATGRRRNEFDGEPALGELDFVPGSRRGIQNLDLQRREAPLQFDRTRFGALSAHELGLQQAVDFKSVARFRQVGGRGRHLLSSSSDR
uniref:Uncharacterized protein n=1 Tax=Rhodopseudomonas palustris (strain BisA53) TaxID=316055 RepID=Q07PN3_RHOP5